MFVFSIGGCWEYQNERYDSGCHHRIRTDCHILDCPLAPRRWLAPYRTDQFDLMSCSCSSQLENEELEMKEKLEIVGAIAAIAVVVGGFWGAVAYLFF